MAKDPAARFPSCGELGDAVAQALSDARLGAARSHAVRDRAPRWVHLLVAGTLLCTVAIVLVERRTSRSTALTPMIEPSSAPTTKPKPHVPKPAHEPSASPSASTSAVTPATSASVAPPAPDPIDDAGPR